MPAYFRLVLHPNPGTLKTDYSGATGITLSLGVRLIGESPVERRRLTIGRAEGNDIPVPDRAVSRHHAVITHDPAGATVCDLNSRNGTRVNSRRIESQRLTHGDVITVGRHRLTYLEETALEPIPAAHGAPPRPLAERPVPAPLPPQFAMTPAAVGPTGHHGTRIAWLSFLAGVILAYVHTRTPVPPPGSGPAPMLLTEARAQPAPKAVADLQLAEPRPAARPTQGDTGIPSAEPGPVARPFTPAAASPEIARLIVLAQAQTRALRLTTPEADNAHTTYQGILERVPDHPAALRGLAEIADRYHELALRSAGEGAPQRALALVGRGLWVTPEHDGLIALRRELRQRLAQRGREQARRIQQTRQGRHPATPPGESNATPAPKTAVATTGPEGTMRGADPQRAHEAPPAERIPEVFELPPQLRRDLQGLRIDLHAYFDDPARRFVLINMREYRHGDRLDGSGARVAEITPEGVVIDYGAGRALLRVSNR
jgi:hypothetical protein